MILDDILEKLNVNNHDKAYTINEKVYTYSELYKFVCNIYQFLIENNYSRPVIVYGHKEVYMKATFLACSFAGITYVPIDESMPRERIELILNQVKPSLIIGNFESDIYKNVTKHQIEEIMFNSSYKEIDNICLKPEDIYYIIFTSGTTGIPKGVKVTYANLDSCVKWLKDVTKIKKEVILNQANFSFDLSVADLYLSLVSGSEHCIIENKDNMDFAKLFEELKESNANLAVMTPSFADLLLLDKSFNEKLMPNLHTILFCGEKLLSTTVKKLKERFYNIKIINSYGPTECTFAVTSIEITEELLERGDIPVGKAKRDIEIIILDETGKKRDNCEIGEILIVGESVADGYLKNDNRNLFTVYNGKKAYLTGDLGCIIDGILYCKGRKDRQIKYKGYRIELLDIENNLQKMDYIEKAVVIPEKNKDNKIIKLIAFIKLKDNITKQVNEIKEDLYSKIPQYMFPKIKIVDEFPINQNGKCDVMKLLKEY